MADERSVVESLLSFLWVPVSAITGVVWRSYGKLKEQVAEHNTTIAVMSRDISHIKATQEGQGEMLNKIYDNQLRHMEQHNDGKSSH